MNTDASGIHQRLIDEDPTAPADLVQVYLGALTNWLIARNPRSHPDDCATAAEDALLALIKAPNSFKAGRQTLDAFLRMSATGDLRNVLQKERRRRGIETDIESVEVSPEKRKYLMGRESDPAVLVALQEAIT